MNKIIISADPGKENFSVAIQSIENGIPRIVHVEMLPFRITDLKQGTDSTFLTQTDKFIEYINNILVKYKPEQCTMERYQVRFRTGGAVAEVVSIMIGVVTTLCRAHKIPVKLVVASEWKNHFNRKSPIDLNTVYKAIKKLPPHVIDSAFIGLYYCLNNDSFYTEKNILEYCQSLKDCLDGKTS